MDRVPPWTVASATVLLLSAACAGRGPAPGATPARTSAAITAADLRTRLAVLADDSMQGRKAGTPGNVKATDYIAAEARRIGLRPAGENGTFFQTVPLVVRRLAPNSVISVDADRFAPWSDYIPRDQGRGARAIEGAQVVYGGVFGDSTQPTISLQQAAGRVVVIRVAPGPTGAPAVTVNRAVVTARFATAAGIAVATLDAAGPGDRESLMQTGAELTQRPAPAKPAFLYVTGRLAQALLGEPPALAQAGDPGRIVHGSIAFEDQPPEAPARNVVALLPGSDPALRGEMVAVGAHSDHLGIAATPVDHDSLRAWNRVMRPHGADDSPGQPTAGQQARIGALLDSLRRVRPARRDSIFNGADDDGSGSVGILEIAEALVPHPPKRSVLFVWHTAEELGLLGSDWFTRHPTVPRDSIVAQLNLDMIGRSDTDALPNGGAAHLDLIGSRRLSTELGDLVERVNVEGKHGFTYDYTYDADGHPANGYCRSDHYNYARFGIPVTFFTTGGHSDYHQVTDEVQYIDFGKMARVASLIADLARTVADLDHRLELDHPRPDPEGVCRQ